MKYIKAYESLNKIQQPFFLRNDRLYISDEIAHRVTPTIKDLMVKYKNRTKKFYKELLQRYIDFFNQTKNEKVYRISREINTLYSTTYGNTSGLGYAMNINILLGNNYSNQSGKFQYYISGRSGDSEMHGKNMIRATKECNLNFMIKLYPILKYIKKFYTKFRLGDKTFLDIIKEEVIKNPSLAQYGIPEELQNELGYYELAFKYNIM